MVAKRFFYICAGILCLALAYHPGLPTEVSEIDLEDAEEHGPALLDTPRG